MMPTVPAGLSVTCYWLAERYVGVREIAGDMDNPLILAMLKLDNAWPSHDEVPWCSAFANWIAWHLRLPRSKDLRARSWLHVGRVVPLADAQVGFDLVIFNRAGGNPQPVFDSSSPAPQPGHVGWLSGRDGDRIACLGGNQSDSVSVGLYPVRDLLGVRRIWGV